MPLEVYAVHPTVEGSEISGRSYIRIIVRGEIVTADVKLSIRLGP
jgi:hypothetical protein